MSSFPSHARVVVIGGGNMGASVLYHLAKAGWTDSVLFEKHELTSGATWHAAGLVSRMIGGYSLGCMHDYAVDLYKSIEEETGQAVSWHGCGSLRVATSDDHLDWINHIHDAVLARGQEAELIDRQEFARLNPLYDADASGVLGALYTPDDGHVDPAGVCIAMSKGARQLGARVIRHCRVTDVSQRPNGEWVVATEQGDVTCEHVVNAGGYHARQIGAFSGLALPITTMQHHYVVTDDVPQFADMDHEIPVTRDDFFCGYMRREQNSVLIGLYDKQAPQAVWLDGCPWESESELFEPNMDGITPWLSNFFDRCPGLLDRGLKQIVNGGITYTPDGAMLLGPAPGLKNYWLACGATVGIAWGPGAGKSLVEWMVQGTAELSMRAFDPRRFGIWADREYARKRATEDYTLRQAMPFPQLQRLECRNTRQSGAHHRTEQAGALYEEAGGWERPRMYMTEEPWSWRRSDSFDVINNEVLAVRNGVGVGDFSAFAQFEIAGPDADAFLNRICANRMPPIGRCCLTAILNESGTYEGEATIAHLQESRYWFVTGAPSERRIWDWLTVHQRGNEDVTITDHGDDFGILLLAGPRARDVLQALANAELESDRFPWMGVRFFEVAGVPSIAMRLSYTGDLAWELHAPNEQLGQLWDAIIDAGRDFGIRPFGSSSLNALRMEKNYRGGHELSNDVSPVEAGMVNLVDFDKEFVGKEALQQRMASGPSSLAICIEVDADGVDVLGGEAVFSEDRKVGSVTSGAYSPTFGKSLAFAYVSPGAKDAPLQVSILGQRRSARRLPEALFDPDNQLIRK